MLGLRSLNSWSIILWEQTGTQITKADDKLQWFHIDLAKTSSHFCCLFLIMCYTEATSMKYAAGGFLCLHITIPIKGCGTIKFWLIHLYIHQKVRLTVFSADSCIHVVSSVKKKAICFFVKTWKLMYLHNWDHVCHYHLLLFFSLIFRCLRRVGGGELEGSCLIGLFCLGCLREEGVAVLSNLHNHTSV